MVTNFWYTSMSARTGTRVAAMLTSLRGDGATKSALVLVLVGQRVGGRWCWSKWGRRVAKERAAGAAAVGRGGQERGSCSKHQKDPLDGVLITTESSRLIE